MPSFFASKEARNATCWAIEVTWLFRSRFACNYPHMIASIARTRDTSLTEQKRKTGNVGSKNSRSWRWVCGTVERGLAGPEQPRHRP